MEKLGLKSITVLLVMFLCCNVMVAQHHRSKALGKAEKVQIDVNKVTITSEDVTMIATAYTPSVVRIRVYKKAHENSQSYAVTLYASAQKISEIDENSVS